jgi:hypothetical protein
LTRTRQTVAIEVNMAGLELAASVLTVVHVVSMLFEQFQNAIKYVQEVISINDPISDLLAKLRDLHRLTKTVASTYTQAESSVSRNSRSLHQIRTALRSCQQHLETLNRLAFSLASQESTTLRKRFRIKKEMDGLKDNIQTLKDNIQWDIGILHSGLACLNLELHVTRGASGSVELPRLIQVPEGLHDSIGDAVFPVSPTFTTLSNADTVFGPGPDLRLRRFSTSPSYTPRPSVSSASSQAPSRTSDRNDSVVSATEITPLTTKNEWKDFEFDIFRRRGSENGIQEIREILQRHPDGTALARSKDTSGRTPLHAAAQHGAIDLARVLIGDHHADVNAQDSRSHTVLDLAVMGKHRDFVALLLEQRVNEGAISPENKSRFREIKGTLLHERRVRQKTRAVSQSEQAELVT